MNENISVALIPLVSGREYVLVADHVKPLQAALRDLSKHLCLNDIEAVYADTGIVFQRLKEMQKKLRTNDRLYHILASYRSRCRTLQQFYRKHLKGEMEAKQVFHSGYLILRGIPFHPDSSHEGWIRKNSSDIKKVES